MKITAPESEAATLAEMGRRLAQYRLNQNLSQVELAELAGVGRNTVLRLEAGESVQTANLVRVLRALGLAANLDALVPEPSVSPLQMVREQRKTRQRASGRRGSRDSSPPKPWEWDDSV